ncbi:trypsin-like peptidase domain-containing protein [Ruminococcus sp.]|uniref:trypsin-like peptidase domain-containing protein n=1 Tax=Ruminococcus sp. TaxID=41978 RepID=UPI003865BD19
MDDLTPKKAYHPEEEYESLEIEQKHFAADNAATDSEAVSQSAAADTPLTAEKPPVEDKIPEPVQETAVPPQAQAQQQSPPAQPAQSAQQPAAYPNTAPPYGCYPYYPQPMQQPVQQPMQQPVQYYYPNTGYQQQPVYPQTAPQPEPPIREVQPYAPMPSQAPTAAQPVNQKPQKQPTSTGTKVFIIILCALLAAMVVGFGFYVASTQRDKGDPIQTPDNPFSFGDDGGSGNGDSEYGVNPFSFNRNGSYTDVEDTITLIADNGETQKRDNDNPDSVGEPDEDAKNIKLEDLPKDKDDDKYTTQSAYNTVSDSVVTVVCFKDKISDNTNDAVAQGSGVIISSDGYLITNAHVIGNSRAYAVNIVMNNGDKHQAKIVGFDTWTDLAVLKIDAKDLKAVTFGDSEKIKIGDDVIAVGSPGGEKFQNTLTRGVISAVDRELSVNKNVRYIQSDAAISPGSSGGPLCNLYGQVIGITTAKAVAENFESMSFSIPSATVERIVGDLIHYGYVKGRTRIGFSGQELASGDYSGAPAGVLVGKIDSEGSLAGSDIKEGDIITELDGQTITSFQDIYDVLDDHKPDDKVTIKAKRPSTSIK